MFWKVVAKKIVLREFKNPEKHFIKRVPPDRLFASLLNTRDKNALGLPHANYGKLWLPYHKYVGQQILLPP